MESERLTPTPVSSSDPAPPDPEDLIFDFVLYLVTSARLNLDEKPIYGAFRMIEGASRLIEATEDLTGGEADGFLTEIQAEIEQNKARMTVDKHGFRAWLAELAARLATEAVTRNLDQDQ